ncbi:MAG: adenylate kinase [Clostridia bacterium]|nr:adenylate kinase [Clostridia bacterium]
MVIIITGASHTGKTLLAQRLLERYSVPYLSIDHLKMGLIRSGNTDLTPEDDDKLTGYLWPIVAEMIKTAVENGQSLIVEGCYVPADWRSYFGAEYLDSIRAVCLAMTDGYIDSRFDEIVSHASDIERRKDDSCCTAERLKEDNRAFIRRFGEEAVLIGEDHEKTLSELLEQIVIK